MVLFMWMSSFTASTPPPLFMFKATSIPGLGHDQTFQKPDSANNVGEVTCWICEQFADLAQYLFSREWTEDAIADSLADLCTFFHIEDKTVCHGVITLFQVLHVRLGIIKHLCGIVQERVHEVLQYMWPRSLVCLCFAVCVLLRNFAHVSRTNR